MYSLKTVVRDYQGTNERIESGVWSTYRCSRTECSRCVVIPFKLDSDTTRKFQ